MNRRRSILLIILIIVVVIGLYQAFHGGVKIGNIRQRKAEIAKKEILAAEKAFAERCGKEGMASAFTAYADQDARILLNDTLLTGKAAISRHYANPKYKQVNLQWTPGFVDASASGDLGYTYGHYTYTTVDSTGKPIIYKGIFHTVWKKKDGVWKFVWDN